MPSSNSAMRARSIPDASRVRLATAREEAMPNDSLYARPSLAYIILHGLSYVPANQEPIMTLLAPAANANATSRGKRTPPTDHTLPPAWTAASAQSRTAENWGLPTLVIMRVVNMEPGPTATLN